MLAAIFISGGINALRNPAGHVEAARPLLEAVSPAVDRAVQAAPVDQRPSDETLVKADAAVKVVAGTMLALGKAPRLAATALAASIVPTTLAAHRFWEETDPQARAAQQVQFFKNVSLLGGLLIAAADTAGKPSLGWRGRRAAESAVTTLSEAGDVVAQRLTGAQAPDRAAPERAKERAAGIAAGLTGLGSGAAAALSDRATKAGAELVRVGGDVSDEWVARAGKARKRAEKRAAALRKKAEKKRARLEKQAERRAAEWAKAAATRRAAWEKAAQKKRRQLEKQAPHVLDQVGTQAARLGHDLAVRASAVGHEIAQQAEGAAQDARKRLAAARS
ncbi:DoxX family protein [Pseudonocardia thermophila]|nr:DoxX family protein [Pseudonocardia thermophila]